MNEWLWVALLVAGAAIAYRGMTALQHARAPRGEAPPDADPAPRPRPVRADARRHPSMRLDDVLALRISDKGKVRLLTQWRQDLLRLDARRSQDAEVLRDIERVLASLDADAGPPSNDQADRGWHGPCTNVRGK